MIEKPEELFVGFVAQKAIIEREGKFLFVKGKRESAKWDLPGGRIHIDEEPEAGLLRELLEELGVACRVKGLITVKRFTHDTKSTPFYFVAFAVEIVDDVGLIQVPEDELSAFAWLSKEELLSDTVYDNCIAAVNDYMSTKT